MTSPFNIKDLTLLASGTYTDVYVCEDGKSVLKTVRNAANTYLLKKEIEIIKQLKGTALANLFPDVLESSTRVCNSCENRYVCLTDEAAGCGVKNSAVYTYDKNMPSLSDVLAKYPNGIDERDMVWMFKRTLGAVCAAHSIGVVHSAIVPEHILLNLETHGIWLLDWMHVNYVDMEPVLTFRTGLPFEVTKDNVAAIDMYMVAECMIKLMGGINNASKDIRLILRACMMEATDAALIHEKLRTTVRRLYGSVFRDFKI